MMPTAFRVAVRRRTDAVVLDLAGVLDGDAAEALAGGYETALRVAMAAREESQETQETVAAIVLNFTGVEYINSTGIALIVGLLARARRASLRLLAYGLSAHYREIFSITRLDEYLPLFADEAAALAGAAATDREGGSACRKPTSR